MNKTTLLFLVILCEGYIVLACELLAIRQLIPFVGSGTECVAIVISGVLLPLAVGYHRGGGAFSRMYQRNKRRKKPAVSIRTILMKNILIALGVLSVGLSFPLLDVFFRQLSAWGLHRLLQTAVYSLIFLITPIFLLGQTVPLVSNYFSRQRLSAITGRMLFFSTTGSFLGAVFSTVVLMSVIGVHNTVIVTLGLLFFLCVLIAKQKFSADVLIGAMLLAWVWMVNQYINTPLHQIVSDNAYNTIAIRKAPEDGMTYFLMNRSMSSSVAKDPAKRFAYLLYIEDNFITPIARNNAQPLDILVLGAGGFTVGMYDAVNHYTFVDIDKALKKVAEAHFLPEKLTPNKQFVVSSARAFVHGTEKKYDIIILDTYTNSMAIPMETISREYLLDVKAHLKDKGVVAANIVSSASFADRFSVRYDNTFSSVFPRHSRQVVYPALMTWKGLDYANVLYIAYRNAFTDDNTAYSDDKNTYSIDIK